MANKIYIIDNYKNHIDKKQSEKHVTAVTFDCIPLFNSTWFLHVTMEYCNRLSNHLPDILDKIS